MKTTQRGFALPTVLVAGIVMMIVLLTALVAASSMRTMLDKQYYSRLARLASESGILHAENCLRDNGFTVEWSDASPLRPNTDCAGVVNGSLSPYIIDENDIRTTYSVGDIGVGSSDIDAASVGSVELLRKASGAVWRSYDYRLRASIANGPLEASVVQSGFLQVCGIFDSQTWCWGGNQYGQLGIGTAYNDGTSDEILLTPVKMHRLPGGLQGKQDKLVSVGEHFICVVTTDNSIYCAGRNHRRQLGNNVASGVPHSSVPVEIAKPADMNGKTITHISAGRAAICVVAATDPEVGGDVYCWGHNSQGRLGRGVTNTQSYPMPARTNTIGETNSRPVIDVASDSTSYHFCAVAKVSGTGRAYCWGYNGRGELGDGTKTDRNAPTAVSTSTSLSGRDIKDVDLSGRYPINSADSCGYTGEFPTEAQYGSNPHCARSGHSCALDTGGRMHCWGANQYGQTGQAAGSAPWSRTTPTRVNSGALSGKNITSMAVALFSSCAIVQGEDDGRGNMYCFGYNNGGQLGRGPTGVGLGCNGTSSYPATYQCYLPELVVKESPGLLGKTIQFASGGQNRYCVITSDYTSYCWGVNNSAGQIGDGTLINRGKPTEAVLLRQYVPSIIY